MEQQNGVCWGNAKEDGAENRGWLIGPFKAEGSPLHQQNLQFKVDPAEAGLRKRPDEATKDDVNWTLQFVISGKVKTSFPATEEQEERHVSVGPGEYCIWGPGVMHYWEILEDSLVLTARWPAI